MMSWRAGLEVGLKEGFRVWSRVGVNNGGQV